MIIMDVNKDEVCIFIPTLNEAPTIESLILSFKEMGYGDILVMDGDIGELRNPSHKRR